MTSFYLSAICCIPLSNPQARLREQAIFQKVAAAAVEQAKTVAAGETRGRWNVKENKEIQRVTKSV
jgi:hypothetical protein